MDQISRMTHLFKDARNIKDNPWIRGWQPPFVHMDVAGGQLHSKGEDEMWTMARRLSSRFPSLLETPYLPHRFPVISSQVHRAAASASAFTSGFFPAEDVGSGIREESAVTKGANNNNSSSCPERRPQAVALSMAPKHADPLLRFYAMCPAYAQREVWLETWLPGWMEEQWAKLAPALQERLGLTRTMTPSEVEDIWQLCQFEAGVEGITSQACSLLSQSDVRLLEWVEDVHLIESHGYGSPINYNIAAPLLHNLRSALKGAAESAAASSSGQPDTHVHLLFAHCETLVPLATLLGLFKPDTEQPLPAATPVPTDGQVPPPRLARKSLADLDVIEDLAHAMRHDGIHQVQAPVADEGRAWVPQGWRPLVAQDDEGRSFRGSAVSPFGANLGLVLYKRKAEGANTGSSSSAYKVRLTYNEQVLPIPGCSSSSSSSSNRSSGRNIREQEENGDAPDCDLDEFLEITSAAAAQGLDALCEVGGNEVATTGSEAFVGAGAPAS
ncbi:histidine phosphatase superfamily [Dunaliella salina]|uniref:Multiple inositol polyphosphate phosphatase 1 n=1 Tax=Dunaliella salina TaxID=3046 RepID=A0ABQ7G0J6_DUNSA|nr:histidine phosphatase superfamily [Dunaliella salina]|eukprot:KAF5828132.1 histidine phosphatase superfamily [Dunaliella salina]